MVAFAVLHFAVTLLAIAVALLLVHVLVVLRLLTQLELLLEPLHQLMLTLRHLIMLSELPTLPRSISVSLTPPFLFLPTPFIFISLLRLFSSHTRLVLLCHVCFTPQPIPQSCHLILRRICPRGMRVYLNYHVR